MSKQTIYINSIASTLPNTQDSPEFVPGKQVSIQEPDYKTLIPDATLRRRMSRIVRMGVATGMQCLNKFPNAPVDAILTATGYGCLGDTEKFMNTLLDNHEQMLTPTAFIQSTFNTIGRKSPCYPRTTGTTTPTRTGPSPLKVPCWRPPIITRGRSLQRAGRGNRRNDAYRIRNTKTPRFMA